MKKSLLFGLLLNVSFSYSIMPATVQLMSALGALGGSACTYLKYKDSDHKYLTIPAVGAIVGGISYWILSHFTPEGKIERAQSILSNLGLRGVLNADIDDEDQFLRRIQDHYIAHDLWLVDAFKHFTSIAKDLCSARNLTISALQESDDQELRSRGCRIIEEIDDAYQVITFGLKVIKNHKDYLRQLSEHNRREYEKEKMKYQREKLVQQRELHSRERY